MSARSIVTHVEPSKVDGDPAALSLALGWAGALDARVVVLAFPVDVGASGSDETDFAATRTARACVRSAVRFMLDELTPRDSSAPKPE